MTPPITNRLLKAVILATALSAAFADNALASQIKITLNNNYRSGSGGEFTVNANDAAANALLGSVLPSYDADTKGIGILLSFQTFCIEKDEFIADNAVFDYTVGPAAIDGGVAGGNPDPVSKATAYLYQQFVLGSLAGYDYTPGAGRQASAGKLQQAIWYFEDELTGAAATAAASNAYVVNMVSMFGSLAGAKADSNGAYGVMALNLTQGTGPGSLKQDQLIYVPDGGLTLMMLGAGMSSLALLRRKLR